MKRINHYKKMFQVENEIDLGQLKKAYRNLVKEWHPDKFQEGDEKAVEAEEMSREIIDGYDFLKSIAPETRTANLAEYEKTINESTIADYDHQGMLMTMHFTDGSTYEYFGVNKNLFIKFHNADKQLRFARRNILQSFTYRKAKREDNDN